MREREPRRMPLQKKIMLLNVGMVCLVLVLAGGILAYEISRLMKESIEEQALAIGRVIARVPEVQAGIQSDNPPAILQPIAEKWRKATGVAFIVISDMTTVRLTHPIAENIWTPMAKGIYREPVLHGQEWVVVGAGSLGPALHAYVPVFDAAGERQIGLVSVGVYLKRIDAYVLSGIKPVLYVMLGALFLSVAGSLLLARNVKKSIFGLEPYEIATILREREATLDAIREGVVAVDVEGRIRLANSDALKMFGLDQAELCGRPLGDIWPGNRAAEVIRTGRAIYDEEQLVNGMIILANTVPITVDGTIAGAVTTFRDRTEVYRLAEELTGIHKFVDLLRAQTHEFKNKLHVVAGLIQLGRLSEAVDVIVNSTDGANGPAEHLRTNVKDVVTMALLLGKLSRAKELGIDFQIAPETSLAALPGRLSSGDMVVILGNLIENAFDAAQEGREDDGWRWVRVAIIEEEAGVTITVANSGPWIDEACRQAIFRRGFSTKGESRGYGLALVAEKVHNSDGTVSFRNLPEGGVEFQVFIPHMPREHQPGAGQNRSAGAPRTAAETAAEETGRQWQTAEKAAKTP